MPQYKLIVNPISGRGTGAKIVPYLRQALEDLHPDLVMTEKPGHARQLALEAALAGFEIVVAVGGDGTANEVLNGLIAANEKNDHKARFGVISVGRGNDLAFGIGVPKGAEEGCAILHQGQTKRIDVGFVVGGLYPEGRYFGNGVGIGFDAVVGFQALKLAPLSGLLSYLVAALETIFLYYKAPQVRVELDDRTFEVSSLMVSIMNGRRMGGGFMMAPAGLVDDGMFDVCIVQQVSRPEIFALIPRFMQGTQESHPAVQTVHSRKVKVTALKGTLPAHADGETLCTQGDSLSIRLLPDAMEVITRIS